MLFPPDKYLFFAITKRKANHFILYDITKVQKCKGVFDKKPHLYQKNNDFLIGKTNNLRKERNMATDFLDFADF